MTTRDEKIRILSDEGWLVPDIAQEVGLSSRQVGRIRRRLGLSDPSWQLDADTKDRIRHLSEAEGWPPGEIARTLDMSVQTVMQYTVPGVGREWRDTARDLQKKYPKLWADLKRAA